MSEHIEEPWKKFRDASGCGISSINGDLIAEGLSEVDSDRIVACVNSLAGVPDELLQDDDKNIINRYTEHLKKETVRQADLLAEVTEERDALKAELDAARKQAPVYASPVPAQKGTPAYSCVYCGCLELEKVTACHCLPQGAEQKWNEHMVFPALD